MLSLAEQIIELVPSYDWIQVSENIFPPSVETRASIEKQLIFEEES